MRQSFWAWRGSTMTANDSLWLYFLLFGATLIGVLVIWIYKQQIYQHFKAKKVILGISRRVFEIICGITIINFMIIRIVILELDDAPFKWEYIPLHFCRMFILISGILLIINKIHWVKYVGIFAILGGLIGMGFSDIKNTPDMMAIDKAYNSVRSPIDPLKLGKDLGFDNFHWWDFVFAHCFVIIVYVMFFIVSGSKGKVTRQSFIYSTIGLTSFSVVVFFLNWIVNSIGVNVAWDPNWFFLGKKGINTLGVLTSWPYALIFLNLFGAIAVLIFNWVYVLQDKIVFVFDKGFVKKVEFKKVKKSDFLFAK